MKIWRLVRRQHLNSAFSGEGAQQYGGRWNPPGIPIVYCSASLSLAVLENLVHFDVSEFPDDFVAIIAILPDQCSFLNIEEEDLSHDWRSYGDQQSLQKLGLEWSEKKEHLILSVPSVVVPEERNYLINPRHPDFNQIKIGEPVPFSFDDRLIR